MNKIGLFLLAGVLTACGSSVIAPNTVDASGDSNSPSQIVSGDLTAQQITYCYGSSMQNVHKGLYQEPANSGIYPIKAKGNFICTRELMNLNVYVRLVVLKLSGSNWIEVGAAENQGKVGTDG